jgi:hypothetical protein
MVTVFKNCARGERGGRTCFEGFFLHWIRGWCYLSTDFGLGMSWWRSVLKVINAVVVDGNLLLVLCNILKLSR